MIMTKNVSYWGLLCLCLLLITTGCDNTSGYDDPGLIKVKYFGSDLNAGGFVAAPLEYHCDLGIGPLTFIPGQGTDTSVLKSNNQFWIKYRLIESTAKGYHETILYAISIQPVS